jgi:manganese-dependent inorganic pyrophosphatase
MSLVAVASALRRGAALQFSRATTTTTLRQFSSAVPDAIKVFGHKNPDTDATCGAIIRAFELQSHGIEAEPFVLGGLNKETEYVLNHFGIETPPLLGPLDESHQVAIVDTNNPAELPDDLAPTMIMSIVDHHKLCGLETEGPIEVDIRPLCSVGSVIYERLTTAGITPPPKIAGLILSCILSDSLEFRSPTTTEDDKKYASQLADICNENISDLANNMFEAKADISHLSPLEIVNMDSKVFTIGTNKLRVSVVETTAPDMALSQETDIIEACAEACSTEGLDDCLMFVVDIINESATALETTPSAAALVTAAWPNATFENGRAVIPNVLSRKKQIIPALESSAQ